MRPEIVERLAQTFEVLIDGGCRLAVEAVWVGVAPADTVKLGGAEFLRLVQSSGLGTRTTYEIARDET